MKPADLTSLLIEKIQSPGATLWEVAELIQMDKLLTSRILKIVNRSYCPEGVSDIVKALQYIGVGTLIQIVLTLKN